jgi:hypothetical protein
LKDIAAEGGWHVEDCRPVSLPVPLERKKGSAARMHDGSMCANMLQ